MGCVWCDVKDSWDASKHPLTSIDSLAENAKRSGSNTVVITGGEPAMYDMQILTSELKEHGLKVHIETSGAYPITGSWHWICFSPKKFKKPIESNYLLADELKVVIYNKHDFEWAETHAQYVRKDCELFLQPEWDRTEQMLPLIINYVKTNPRWRISLQTHKFMDIP